MARNHESAIQLSAQNGRESRVHYTLEIVEDEIEFLCLARISDCYCILNLTIMTNFTRINLAAILFIDRCAVAHIRVTFTITELNAALVANCALISE